MVERLSSASRNLLGFKSPVFKSRLVPLQGESTSIPQPLYLSSAAVDKYIAHDAHQLSPATCDSLRSCRKSSNMSFSTGSAIFGSSNTPIPSTTTTIEELPSLEMGIKYVDSKYDEDNDAWEYEETSNPNVSAELVQPIGTDTSDEDSDWSKFCFVVVRKHKREEEKHKRTISFEIVIKSSYLLTACRDVMQQAQGISWVSEPVIVSTVTSSRRASSSNRTPRSQLDPKLLIAFFPNLEAYEQKLALRACSQEDERVLSSLRVLLDWIRKNYRQTLARVASLGSHGEITFDLLYAILLPGTTIIRRCPITHETRALRLIKSEVLTDSSGQQFVALECEGLEEMLDGDKDADNSIGWSDSDLTAHSGGRFGFVKTRAVIKYFNGVEKINTLSAFPIQYHRDPDRLTALLLARARKWASLSGIHHMHCRGTASRWEWIGDKQILCKYSVSHSFVLSPLS